MAAESGCANTPSTQRLGRFFHHHLGRGDGGGGGGGGGGCCGGCYGGDGSSGSGFAGFADGGEEDEVLLVDVGRGVPPVVDVAVGIGHGPVGDVDGGEEVVCNVAHLAVAATGDGGWLLTQSCSPYPLLHPHIIICQILPHRQVGSNAQ